jgi:hypothetical protein
MQNKANQNASTLKANLINLQTAIMNLTSDKLTGPLKTVNDVLNEISKNPERMDAIINKIIGLGIALAGIRIGAGVLSFVATLKSGFRGKSPAAALDGGGGGGGAGIPVHVTNWGGAAGSSSLPGAPITGGTAGIGKTPNGQPPGTPLGKPRMGITGKQAAVTGGAAALAAAAFAVPQMVRELNDIKQDETLTVKERGKAKGGAIGGAAGYIGGAAVGAIAGAAIGSVVPVVGTAIGALAGGLIGYFGGMGGRVIGEKIGEAVAKDKMTENLQHQIPPNLREEINNVPQIPAGSARTKPEDSAFQQLLGAYREGQKKPVDVHLDMDVRTDERLRLETGSARSVKGAIL